MRPASAGSWCLAYTVRPWRSNGGFIAVGGDLSRSQPGGSTDGGAEWSDPRERRAAGGNAAHFAPQPLT